MPKLTDSQLVILSAAARRKDGAVLPLPRSLQVNKAAATTVIKGLLKKGLVAERPAAADEAHWRDTRDGGRTALAITDAGLQAIGTGQVCAARAAVRSHSAKRSLAGLLIAKSARRRGEIAICRLPDQDRIRLRPPYLLRYP